MNYDELEKLVEQMVTEAPKDPVKAAEKERVIEQQNKLFTCATSGDCYRKIKKYFKDV